MFQKYLFVNLLFNNFVIDDSLDSRIVRSCGKDVEFRFCFFKLSRLRYGFFLVKGIDVMRLFDFFEFLVEDKLLLFVKFFDFFVFLVDLGD